MSAMREPAELARVRRAKRALDRANAEYVDALVAARAAGRSLAEVAGPAGCSRQWVRKLTVSRTGD